MKKYCLLLLFLSALLASCGTFNSRTARPIYVVCKKPKLSVVDTCEALLKQMGYRIEVRDVYSGIVEGFKPQTQTSLGENLIYNGPYAFNAFYRNDTVVVNISTVIKGFDGRYKVEKTHNETNNTNEADRRMFVPIIEGIRDFCRN